MGLFDKDQEDIDPITGLPKVANASSLSDLAAPTGDSPAPQDDFAAKIMSALGGNAGKPNPVQPITQDSLGGSDDMEDSLTSSSPKPIDAPMGSASQPQSQAWDRNANVDPARQKLVDAVSAANKGGEDNIFTTIAPFLGGLSSAFSKKGDFSSGFNASIKRNQDRKQNALNQYDKGTQQAKDNYSQNVQVTKDKSQLAQMGDENDPGSDSSKLAQWTAQKMGLPAEMTSGLTATKFKSMGPMAEKALQIVQGNDTKRLLGEMRNQAASQHASDKSDTDILNRSRDAQKMIETARGAPDLAQALKDQYATGKVSDLIKMTGNNPSSSMAHMIASEIGRVAQGGSPTNATLKGILPDTIPSELAQAVQKFTGNPTPAGLQGFIKDYSNYNNSLSAGAKKLIKDRTQRVIDGQLQGSPKYAAERSRLNKLYGLDDQPQQQTGGPSQGQSKHAAGDIVKVKGQTYRVGADGDSLEPVDSSQ